MPNKVMNFFRQPSPKEHRRLHKSQKLIELHDVPQTLLDDGINAMTLYRLLVHWIQQPSEDATWLDYDTTDDSDNEEIVKEFDAIYFDLFHIILSYYNHSSNYDTHWSSCTNSKVVDLIEDYKSLILENSRFRHRSDNTTKWKVLNMDHIITVVDPIPHNQHFVTFTLEIYQEYNDYCEYIVCFLFFCLFLIYCKQNV